MDNKLQNINHNIVYLMIEKVSILMMNLILILFIPKVLNYYEVSAFFTALAFSSVVWLLMELGVNNHIINIIPLKNKYRNNDFSDEYILKIILSGLLFCISLGFVIISNYDVLVKTVVLILTGSMIFNNLAEFYISIIKGLEVMKFSMISNLVYVAVTLLLSLISLLKYESIVLVAFSFMFGRIIFLVTSVYLFRLLRYEIKIFNKFSFKILILLAITSIRKIHSGTYLLASLNFSVIILSIYNFNEVGYFAIFIKIISSIYIVLASISEAFYPRFCKSHIFEVKNKKLLLSAFKKISAPVILFLILIWTFTSQIVFYVWGLEFIGVVMYMQMGAILLPIFMSISLFHYYLISIDKFNRSFYYLCSFLFASIVMMIASNHIEFLNNHTLIIICTSSILLGGLLVDVFPINKTNKLIWAKK